MVEFSARFVVRNVVTAVVAGLVVTGAATAARAVEPYELKIVSLPGSFEAGGQGGIMTISVTRRVEGCERIRALMLVTLKGMVHGDLKVEVKTNTGWDISPISNANENTLRAEDNWVDVQFLCLGQTRQMQHRIVFLAGAPAGAALFDSVVLTVGNSAEASRVHANRPVRVGGGGVAPSPTRAQVSATPNRTTVPGTPSLAAPSGTLSAGRTARGVAAEGPAGNAWDAKRLVSMAGLVAGGALATLALGILLIVLFIRRRHRHEDPGGRGHPDDPAQTTIQTTVLPIERRQ